MKLKINGIIYQKAREQQWLSSLAVFMYLRKINPGGQFGFKNKTAYMQSLSKELGIGISALYKHCATLKKKGLIEDTDKGFRLASKKQQAKLYAAHRKGIKKYKSAYVDADKVETMSDMKYYLKFIPVISALEKQCVAYNLKELTNAIKSHNFHKKVQKKYKASGELKPDNELKLSLQTIMRLCDVSKPTAVSGKKFLKRIGVLDYRNEVKEHKYGHKIDKRGLEELKRTNSKLFLSDGRVFERLPSIFILLSFNHELTYTWIKLLNSL